MILRLWLWWNGSVTVRINGADLERFLNRVAAANIPIWRLERLTSDVLIARMLIRDFVRLRPILWKSSVNVSILDRHGFPVMLQTMRSRIFLGLGLLIVTVFLLYLGSFVWFIEVAGLESIAAEEIAKIVEAQGVKVGVPVRNVQNRKIETALLTNFPQLVWAQVGRKGVKVVINVAEQVEYSTQENKGELYAGKDGLITDVLVLKGTAVVQTGDTVRAGDLLVKGEYYDQWGRKQIDSAEAIVRARVWHQGVGEAGFNIWEPQETGKKRYQFLLTIGSLAIPLGRSYPLENYIRTTREWCLSLGRAMLPLRWTKVEYRQVEYIKKPVPYEQARRLARERALKNLEKKGVDLEQIQAEREEEFLIQDGEGIHYTLWVEVEEELGVFSPQ